MGRNVIKAAGLLLLINTCVKLLGFVREMAMAGVFGASALTDAYQVAYTLPYFFQTVLGYAFVSAVLPLLSRCWQEQGDNRVACRLGSTLINISAAGMLAVSAAGVLAARLLVWLTAPDLDQATAALATELTRIIFPSVVFMSVAMVISGILNCRYRFIAAALGPGVTSLSVIAATAWLSKGDITVVAWGTLAGFVGFFLLTLADLPRTGFRYSFSWELKNPEIRRVLLDILPIVLGLAVTQIYTIVNRIFASSLDAGSIAVLNYAGKVMNMPLGVFVAALITASFPLLAEQARQMEVSALAAVVRKNLAMIWLVALPAALGLGLLSQPIIQLLFEGGQFTPADTVETGLALTMMSPSVLFLGVSMLLIRVYYAMGDVKTPLLTGGISIAIHVLMSFLCLRWFGDAAGLGFANSVAAAVNAGLLWYMLRNQIVISEASYNRELKVITLTFLILAVLIRLLSRFIIVDQGKLMLLLTLLAVIGGTVIVYFAVLKLLRSQSLADIRSAFRRRSKDGGASGKLK